MPKGDETVEHLLKNLKSKQLLLHYRHSSLEQIDRAYKFVKTTEQDRKPVPFTYLTQGGKTISKEPSSKKWKTVRTNNSSCKSLLNDQKNVLESKEYRQKQS